MSNKGKMDLFSRFKKSQSQPPADQTQTPSTMQEIVSKPSPIDTSIDAKTIIESMRSDNSTTTKNGLVDQYVSDSDFVDPDYERIAQERSHSISITEITDQLEEQGQTVTNTSDSIQEGHHNSHTTNNQNEDSIVVVGEESDTAAGQVFEIEEMHDETKNSSVMHEFIQEGASTGISQAQDTSVTTGTFVPPVSGPVLEEVTIDDSGQITDTETDKGLPERLEENVTTQTGICEQSQSAEQETTDETTGLPETHEVQESGSEPMTDDKVGPETDTTTKENGTDKAPSTPKPERQRAQGNKPGPRSKNRPRNTPKRGDQNLEGSGQFLIKIIAKELIKNAKDQGIAAKGFDPEEIEFIWDIVEKVVDENI